MSERWKLLALLLDEVVLVLLYLVLRFPFEYFVVFISIVVAKDIFVILKAWNIFEQQSLLGMESLISCVGEVVSDIDPSGQVKIGNEIWLAESDEFIPEGEKAIVRDTEGLVLKVEKYTGDENEE